MGQVPILGRPSVVPATMRILSHTSRGLYVTRRFPLDTFAMATATPRRRIQSSSRRPSPPSSSSSDASTLNASTVGTLSQTHTPEDAAGSAATMAKHSPLAVLPLSTVLRTLATNTISSSPVLLPPSLFIMSKLAHATNPLMNPDRNPLLRYFLKKTFYAQFCAGENAAEVRATVSGLKRIGFTGVILGYAREVVLTQEQTLDLGASIHDEACLTHEITPWKNGTLETVKIAQPGDFVALKFSGAGRHALHALKNRLPPSKELRAAIDEICELARERDVPLLFDAEQMAVQAGIDDWTLEYQRRYNTKPGHAIIHGTYQAYLKSTPATLASHLVIAAKEGFTLGVKLVRGAYMGSDPREIIHDTKADTDRCYNGIAESLIKREWGPILAQPQTADSKSSPTSTSFPQVSLVLGSHNLESVRKARAIRDAIPATEGCSELAIAQLQGMADDVSCELICVKKADSVANEAASKSVTIKEKEMIKGGKGQTRAYKYIVWGSTGECMAYLLRRAYENRDAVQRTLEGRNAMWGEVKRRAWGVFGRGA
ncbi:FAD-linked oxidoreductase [Pseudomassariella vexata]|uniref:Proline dehydrogenase n=1 Tax=Pseudomassariella vexata TaxID=1141098 RepID=A0A1Y2D9S2_9PEZI|nr:FAD-linked oxidoreductase [Pseudomassariella vexata]ORY55924.1 FAD-linked oxidoreductase [Pseudomassariella vexata]